MESIKVAVIIPAFQPQQELRKVKEDILRSRLAELNYHIFLINDGSTENLQVFQDIIEDSSEKITLIEHEVNRGKGAALKTGMKAVIDDGTFTHVVTVDADGQHRVEDIMRVLNAIQLYPHDLILGSRSFTTNVPARSRLGNKITEVIFNFFTGLRIKDTQTGLRAFDVDFAKRIIALKQDRYDFELGMLMRAVTDRKSIMEIEIETVYIEDNASSHFRPLTDSLLIYMPFIKFSVSSFISISLDYILFLIFYNWFESIFEANILARCIAAPVNYYLNKKFVFEHKGRSRKTFLMYITLAAINPLVVASLVTGFKGLNIPVYVGKIIAESCMFVVNFLTQKRIFKVSKEKTKPV